MKFLHRRYSPDGRKDMALLYAPLCFFIGAFFFYATFFCSIHFKCVRPRPIILFKKVFIMNKQQIKKITITAMLCALSFAAVLVSKIIPDVAGFLSYDPKDAIVAIAGFIYGPLTSVVISLTVSFIEMITISSTGPIGFVMNVISTCAFTVPAAIIYKKMRVMKGAVLGLSVGAIAMTASMLLWNYLITPLYMSVERSQVAAMLIPTFLPFNFIKSGLNLALALVLYKPMVTALRKTGFVPKSSIVSTNNDEKHTFRAGIMLISILLFALFAVLFLAFTKVI